MYIYKYINSTFFVPLNIAAVAEILLEARIRGEFRFHVSLCNTILVTAAVFRNTIKILLAYY